MRFCVFFSIIVIISLSSSAFAQTIVSDRTLDSVVNNTSNNAVITGGRSAGGNLFHSFQDFSVSTGSTTTFDLLNTPNVTTIFSRITGPHISRIDGLLRITNNSQPTSLFLMNPNGIVFGPNATLDFGGSFVGTTADRIQFKDGFDFTRSANVPLLSVNVPIGLQMGAAPGAIEVQGTGNLLKTQSTLLAPYIPIGASNGLQVSLGNTLALVGGNITIDGGILTASGGRVELASLGSNASVAILKNNPGIVLGDVLGDRLDVRLSNKALVDVSGVDSGSIQVQARQIDFTTGAILWIQNQNVGGNVTVNATDRILADGTSLDFVEISADGPVFSSVSGIVNETLGGDEGEISLSAPSVTVQNGASIISRSFGAGAGGDVIIQAKNLTVSGASEILGDVFSIVGTSTADAGKGGKVDLNVQNLALLNGGVVTALTTGAGNSGDVMVNADRILISGLSPSDFASSLSVPTLGGQGKAGNILINTRQLTISEGGALSSLSFGPGNAGTITVNASESIDIIGFQQRIGNYQTGISSVVAPPLEPYKSLFNLPDDNATGNSGDVVINTGTLRVYKQGFVTVENTGSGDAGMLKLKTDRIELIDSGFLSAGTEGGQGGNILIQTSVLLMRRSGDVLTTSIGNRGGNIDIVANVIVGLADSDIIANSTSGMGGRIKITTQGLFGLKFRDQLTIENDITASSDFGISGTVQINNIAIDPSAALNVLPTDFSNASQMISNRCDSNLSSRFIITGQGGLRRNPSDRFQINRSWGDIRSANQMLGKTVVLSETAKINSPILEASSFHRDADGVISLVANGTSLKPSIVAACSTNKFD